MDVSHAVLKCESSNIGRRQRGPSHQHGWGWQNGVLVRRTRVQRLVRSTRVQRLVRSTWVQRLVRSTWPLIKPRPKGESVKARPKGDGSPSVAALGVLVLCTSLDGLAHTGSWCSAPALTAFTAKPRPLGLGPTDQGLSTTVPLGQYMI